MFIAEINCPPTLFFIPSFRFFVNYKESHYYLPCIHFLPVVVYLFGFFFSSSFGGYFDMRYETNKYVFLFVFPFFPFIYVYFSNYQETHSYLPRHLFLFPPFSTFLCIPVLLLLGAFLHCVRKQIILSDLSFLFYFFSMLESHTLPYHASSLLYSFCTFPCGVSPIPTLQVYTVW
jgi:hypothetical protein